MQQLEGSESLEDDLTCLPYPSSMISPSSEREREGRGRGRREGERRKVIDNNINNILTFSSICFMVMEVATETMSGLRFLGNGAPPTSN